MEAPTSLLLRAADASTRLRLSTLVSIAIVSSLAWTMPAAAPASPSVAPTVAPTPDDETEVPDTDIEEDEGIEEEPATPKPDPVDEMFWRAIKLLDSDAESDQKRGREMLSDAADREHVWAQFFLAEAYLRGSNGLKKSERKAAELFRLAAERGNAPAQAWMGLLTTAGKGVRRDSKKAIEWMERAAAGEAAFEPPTAPEWFFQPEGDAAAPPPPVPLTVNVPSLWEQLFARNHYFLGRLLDEANKPEEALVHYEIAATAGINGRAGNFDANRRAAMAYAMGRGTTRDLDKANERLSRGRDLARASVMASAQSLWSRKQVDNYDLADIDEAVSKAADAQLVEEQIKVANVLFKSSPTEARRWCEIAAENGDIWAMIKLAEAHYEGRGGPRDLEKSFEWYRRAAEEGDSFIGWGLFALFLRDGIGTPPDPNQAKAILAKHGRRNFICALIEVGLQPKDDFRYASWSDLLETCAKKKIPIAQYFYAARLESLSNLLGQPMSFGAFEAKIQESKAMYERAAKAGIPEAWYRLGQWAEAKPDLKLARECYEKGLAAGNSSCAMRLADFASDGKGQSVDPIAAADLYLRAIALDPENAAARNNLAVEYKNLVKNRPDAPERAAWKNAMLEQFQKADEQEGAYAAYNLGMLYYEGTLLDQDYRQAYMYFQTAAERGHPTANRYLGQMHQRGEGVPVTPKDAFYYYRLAALDNDDKALAAVCNFYLTGQGVDADLDKAMFWLRKLIAKGDARALVTFGDALLQKGNYADAHKLWTSVSRAKSKNFAAYGYDRLSRIYEKGLGVKPNASRAAQFHKKAIDGGCPETLCREGRNLIAQQKPADAARVLEPAVAAKSPEALYILGCLLAVGNGVPKDEDRAFKLLNEAARLGDSEAKLALAVATLKGNPRAPDFETALRYAQEVEAAGNTKAKRVREVLEKRSGSNTPPAQAPAPDSGRARST